MHCRYFDTTLKDSHTSFLTPTEVDQRRSLLSDVCAISTPLLRKYRLQLISAYNVSTEEMAKSSIMTNYKVDHGLSNEV